MESRKIICQSFPIKMLPEWNHADMNERMLEIKVLNLSLSLLSMLIVSLVKPESRKLICQVLSQ